MLSSRYELRHFATLSDMEQKIKNGLMCLIAPKSDNPFFYLPKMEMTFNYELY